MTAEQNVNLWINNDKGLYLLAKECISGSINRDGAAEFFMDTLKEIGVEKTPDGYPYSKTAVKKAMRGM